MASVREAWTDERLDDLNGRVSDLGRRVDEGFTRMDAKIDLLRKETKAEIIALRGEMLEEISALHRLILQVGGGMIATFVVGFLAVVATQ